MALLTICNRNQTLTDEHEIREYLNSFDIDYECWPTTERVAPGAPPEEILAAYSTEIEKLKAAGGYVTADVIDVTPDTPGLAEMLAHFDKEHWHDEDEVRFVISGRGIFHIHFGVRRPVGAFAVGDLSQRDFASTSEQKPERRQVAALQRDEVV
ncbi:MAG TPA: hypothetical protein VL866_17660, partial [Pyrinomonadaceae bacterium]|nr:hypothetical protein [Pyrinomonadaceae bacterium]